MENLCNDANCVEFGTVGRYVKSMLSQKQYSEICSHSNNGGEHTEYQIDDYFS